MLIYFEPSGFDIRCAVDARPGHPATAAKSSGSDAPMSAFLGLATEVEDDHALLARLREAAVSSTMTVLISIAKLDARDEGRPEETSSIRRVGELLEQAFQFAPKRKLVESPQQRDFFRAEIAALRAELARRDAETGRVEQTAMLALAYLAEARDADTGNHLLRTQHYVRLLATKLRAFPRFSSILTDRYIDLLTWSAPLHDIGKVGIPDRILLKPDQLTEEETAIMRTHTTLGARVIEQTERDMRQPAPFLAVAKEIAHWHHERWDGSGYPDGLSGAEIPLSARVTAVVDVFDALISNRVYKRSLPFEEARKIIAAGRGAQFDPDVTDAFLTGFDDFVSVAVNHSDHCSGPTECRD